MTKKELIEKINDLPDETRIVHLCMRYGELHEKELGDATLDVSMLGDDVILLDFD